MVSRILVSFLGVLLTVRGIAIGNSKFFTDFLVEPNYKLLPLLFSKSHAAAH
jgi:hypothetical protein